MSNNKDVVLTTINETKKEIKSFKNELLNKREQLPDINAIAKSLKGIGKVIEELKTLCNDKTKTLESLIEELSYAQIKELLNKTDIMFDVINDNLPNGMMLETATQNDYRDSEKVREIWFNDDRVGKVQILSESDNTLCVEVAINDAVDKFEVEKPNRMYHIISFINTKFNYE